jgi:hypothetical protein
VGNKEASLIFAVGTDIQYGKGGDAAIFLVGGGCRAVIVEHKADGAFAKKLAELSVSTNPVLRVKGITIANGRRLEYGVYGSSR